MASRVPPGVMALVTAEPYLAWARVAALFHPPPPPRPGIHPAAVVDPSAQIDPSAEIGPLAVIGARVEIGASCRVGPGAVIGEAVQIGAHCRIGSQATVSHAVLGARVYIYPGARIGQEGFGFAVGPEGFVTVPQLGRVLIEDDVEIGANSAVDRGSAQDTVIGAGSRLDNLVQIGHNVRLGRCCIVVSQAGISGSHCSRGFRSGRGAGGPYRAPPDRGESKDRRAGRGDAGRCRGCRRAGRARRLPVREFFRQVATLRKLPPVQQRGARRGTERWTPKPISTDPATTAKLRHRTDHARDPASLPDADDRPRDRRGPQPVRDRRQERLDQRELLPGAFPGPSRDARRAHHREHGADRGRAGGGDAWAGCGWQAWSIS